MKSTASPANGSQETVDLVERFIRMQGRGVVRGDVPLRAAIATSNFMIGVTAATSALIYYQRGFLDPNIAIPTALGVLVGAQIGTRIGGKVRSKTLKQIFQGLLLVFAVQMIYQAVTG